jgi:type I restriction enzyme, S subunit
MQYLFTNGTRGERRKKTEIGEMPESWQLVRLGELCSFTTGALNSEATVKGGEYPFFTCARETFAINSYSFDQEAVLLAGNNAQGVYSVKHYKGKFDAYQRTYIISIIAANRLRYRFLLYDLSLKLDLLRRQSLGATTKFLTASIIRSLKLTLPSIEEQLLIASTLWACDTRIQALESECTLLDELFKTILEELMTGRLSAIPLVESEAIA